MVGIEDFRFCKSVWFMSEANQAPIGLGLHAVMNFVFFTFGMGATFSSDGSYRSDLVLGIEVYCNVVLFDC